MLPLPVLFLVTGVWRVGADPRGVPKLNQQQFQGWVRNDEIEIYFFILRMKEWNRGYACLSMSM